MQLTEPGHILALAHGRKYDCGDTGWIDVVSRRSYDNGKTWDDMTLVYSGSDAQNNVTIGTVSGNFWPVSLSSSTPPVSLLLPTTPAHRLAQPSAVADLETGTVFLFTCREFVDVLLMSSDDGGREWSEPQDLTSQLVDPTWQSVYTGLPQGLQLSSGRLIICANHMYDDLSTKSHTIFSDDHGKSWTVGKSVGPR